MVPQLLFLIKRIDATQMEIDWNKRRLNAQCNWCHTKKKHKQPVDASHVDLILLSICHSKPSDRNLSRSWHRIETFWVTTLIASDFPTKPRLTPWLPEIGVQNNLIGNCAMQRAARDVITVSLSRVLVDSCYELLTPNKLRAELISILIYLNTKLIKHSRERKEQTSERFSLS